MANKTCDSRQIGPRYPANFPHRHPVFAELERLPRFKKRIRFLITKQSGLYFKVTAVIVGKRFAPIQAICIGAHDQIFLAGSAA